MEGILQRFLLGKDCSSLRKCCIKEIERVASPIARDEFLLKYVIPNVPCILEPWATKEWPSIKDWVENGTNRINRRILNDKFGLSKVPVVECRNSSGCGSVTCLQMLFIDFMTYLDSSNDQQKCLYLKDWHCYREHPNYKFYDNPIYFQSDWLNEFWDDQDDDYRFVYIGPKESWTPHHADVFRSYSWSANVSGRKKWIINSACFNSNSQNCDCPKVLEITQERGEIIFIPSGWFHEVHNLEETISINHNWINAFNIDLCWKYLKDQLASAEREIIEWKHVEEFSEQCQKILRADTGMDYGDFFNFIHFIAIRRMIFIENCMEFSGTQSSTVILEHNSCCKLQCTFQKTTDQFLKGDATLYLIDLNRIIHVLDDFIKELHLCDCTKPISDKCSCQPLKFLSLLECFTATALSCLNKGHQIK